MKKVLGYTLSQRWSKPYNFDLSFRTLQFVVDHDGLRRGRSHKPPPNQTHQQQRFCWYMKYTYLIISKRNLNFHSGPLLLKSFENYYIKNSNHARKKRRFANDPCLFQLYLLWISNMHLCCLLKYWNGGKKKQSKQSALYKNKHCFLFPLSFFVTAAVFTRVPFFDRNAKGP